MTKKNKFYWLEGVTEKGVTSLLKNDSPSFRWVRPQRNRRFLVVAMAIGLVLISLGSYYPNIKTNLNLSNGTEIVVYSLSAVWVILSVIGGYSLLRISVRSIADAPDDLLDERQIQVRNTSFRYAYYAMGYIVMGLLLLMLFGPALTLFEPQSNDGSYLLISMLFTFACLPSMILAWREKDI